jgi:UDP-N-acetylmuramate dehydrogenase
VVRLDEIQKIFRGKIAIGEPLKEYTWFRIGGPADYYCEPADREDVVNIVGYFQKQHFPFLILGKGSNVLVSDDGIRGAVINLGNCLSSVHAEGNTVYAEAGVTIVRFVDFCVQRGLKGVEMLAGIPGTIGGALIMNAGAYGGEISDYLVDVELLNNGVIELRKKTEITFSYRRSGFRNEVILGAGFTLPQGNKEEVVQIRKDLLLKRNRTQPTNMPNSGSMFKNPEGNFAARLIEQAGLKGTRIGGAQISEKHANFIVNHGDATARDVMGLINLAKKKVFENNGIHLELEVKLLGFDDSVEKGRTA